MDTSKCARSKPQDYLTSHTKNCNWEILNIILEKDGIQLLAMDLKSLGFGVEVHDLLDVRHFLQRTTGFRGNGHIVNP